MTIANGARFLGPLWGFPTIGPSGANFALDASNDGVGWICQSQSTQPITHLGFRYASRTGTPPTYIIGLESASTTTGFPDGIYKTNGGNCSGTFTPPASSAWDGTWQWVALDNSYTPTLGEILAITIRHHSDPIGVSNSSSVTTSYTGLSPLRNGFSYATRLTAGAWAKSSTAPVFGIRTASLRYGPIVQDMYATATPATAGHRMASKITIPAGFGDVFKLLGVRFSGQCLTAGRIVTLKIWDSGGSVLTSIDIDTDVIFSAFSYQAFEFYFNDSITLNFGDTYYIGMEVGSPASAVLIHGVSYADSADFADIDGGASMILSTYNGTSWTDNPLVRPLMELILDDWTEPTGGGGGLLLPVVRPI